LIASSKVALQNHSIVRIQTIAERQLKHNHMLSLPNGNLFFLLPTFLFQQKQTSFILSLFLLPVLLFSAKHEQSLFYLFFLLPTFLFSAKRKVGYS